MAMSIFPIPHRTFASQEYLAAQFKKSCAEAMDKAQQIPNMFALAKKGVPSPATAITMAFCKTEAGIHEDERREANCNRSKPGRGVISGTIHFPLRIEILRHLEQSISKVISIRAI
jgi:hypothetical protein